MKLKFYFHLMTPVKSLSHLIRNLFYCIFNEENEEQQRNDEGSSILFQLSNTFEEFLLGQIDQTPDSTTRALLTNIIRQKYKLQVTNYKFS